MGDLASWSERRRALRVPVRGVAVFYAEDGAMHGTIENLSSSGALVTRRAAFHSTRPRASSSSSATRPAGSARARCASSAARTPRGGSRSRSIASTIRCAARSRAAIEHALARSAAPADPRDRRSHGARAGARSTRLAARGMTPLAPRTPLEAIDLLTRTQLHVNVLRARAELRPLPATSFARSCPTAFRG